MMNSNDEQRRNPMNHEAGEQPTQSASTDSALPLLWLFVLPVVALAMLLIGGAAGFGAGRASVKLNAAPSAASVDIEQGFNQGSARTALEPEFGVFWEALDLLYGDFYGDLPAGNAATYGAIRGVVDLLDDPNTAFLTPQEADVFRSSMQGTFEGIGARVNWDEELDTLVLVEPFENQPAWNEGLRRGDAVLAIDGESIVGTDLNSAVAKIRGPEGSVVVLTILRPDADAHFDVTITRAAIETPTIATEALGAAGEIAYVRLNSFNQNSGQLVRQAVESAVERGAEGLIFDLRGNTGGLLREAVRVAGIFLKKDDVVLIERFSDGSEQIYTAEGRAVAPDLPLVVLVNESSASASEIVAGALQDAGRAPLIGVTTFGKGSVQLPSSLSDGSIMRVTIARWYTPLDRSIDGTGLEPDQVVEQNDENSDADPQLDAALEYLKGIRNQE